LAKLAAQQLREVEWPPVGELFDLQAAVEPVGEHELVGDAGDGGQEGLFGASDGDVVVPGASPAAPPATTADPRPWRRS